MLAKNWIVSGTCALLVMSSGAFSQDNDRPPRPEGKALEQGGERGPRGEGGRGHRPPPFADILERHDTNKDGKLQRSEAPERMPDGVFARLDANKDGAIDVAEAKKAQGMRQGRRGQGGRDGKRPEGREGGKRGQRQGAGMKSEGRGRGGEHGGRGGGRMSAVEMFERMDANGDGVVNREEAEALDRERRLRRESGGDRQKRGGREGGQKR